MPLEAPLDPVAVRIEDLNQRYAHHSSLDVLEHALFDPQVGRTAMVSSFGAESAVLLHMVSVVDRTTPVLFLDTEMLFPETLDYQREVSARLGLTNVQVIHPDRGVDEDHDALARRRGFRRSAFSVPPKAASRRALSKAISASSPLWINAVFSLTPVST